MSVTSNESRVVKLANQLVEIGVETENGRLVSLLNKRTGVQYIQEPQIADSFRLLVPAHEYLGNYVIGRDMPATSVQCKHENGASFLEIRYHNVQSRVGPVAVDVTARYSIKDASEDIHCTIEIDNRTENLVVEESWFPIISGITGVGDPARTDLIVPTFAGEIIRDPLHNLPDSGIWDARCHYYHHWYPGLTMQWIALNNGTEGLYACPADQTCALTGFHFEKYPDRGFGQMWHNPPPRIESLHFSINKFPYLKPGQSWRSPEMVISLHMGDWHKAADKYRSWAMSWMRFPKPPKWLAEEFIGWESTMICSSAEVIHHKYEDLPQMLDNAMAGGVNTLDLVGWSDAMVRRYPDFTPRERFGGPEGLKKALAQVHAKGGRVIAWGTANRADMSTDWYKNELHKYSIKNNDGVTLTLHWGHDVLGYMGQQMCYGQGAYVAEMCTSCPEWRDILAKHEIDQMIELGLDGVQLDEICGSARLCYDPAHGHERPGEAVTVGTLELAKMLFARARAKNPEFAVTGEEACDSLMQYLDLSFARGMYNRTPNGYRLFRYTFPELKQTFAVGFENTVPDEMHRLNTALLAGYFVNYEIHQLGAQVKDLPELAAYGSELLKIRKQYREYLIDGRYLDTLEADVAGNVRYGVFKGPHGYAVVLANDGASVEGAFVSLPLLAGKATEVKILAPFTSPQEGISLPVSVTIKPHSAVVVIAETKRDSRV